jgi:hypothetical protein
MLDAALNRINDLTPSPDQAVMRAKLRGLLRGYSKRYASDSFAVLSIEQTRTSELYNPATQARSRSFRLAGKLDLMLEENTHTWLMDHKTCSEEIADPNAPYWKQLVIEGQHQHYMLLEHLNGRRVDGAIWDVTRKPGISPRQITKAEQAQISATGLWFGDPAEVTDRETPEMYEARVAHDCSVIRPDHYFQRRRIARMDHQLIEYAGELWQHSQDLLWARRQGSYPRNSGACMNYGRPCQYLGICSGYDEATSSNWQRREWVHPELEADGTSDGRDMLTNSRIRCFQSCRKKHYFQYEVGIERAEQEEIETLHFGHIYHEALAVWFQGLMIEKEIENGNHNNEPATEVGCVNGREN